MTNLQRLTMNAQRTNVPISVLFEITGRCSLDCQHCYLDIRQPPEEMSTREICDTLDQLAAAGALFLAISGGEVFLRRDLMAILGHARSLGFAVRLFTSGTRMTRDHARTIASLSLAAVEMSLYGAHDGLHDAITRRPGSHRKTLRAASMLRRLGVPVVLKSPILSGVAHGHRAFLDLAARVGAKGKLDAGIITRRDGDRAPAALRPTAEALAAVLRDPEVFGECRPLPPPIPGDEAPCAIGRRTCRIGPDGGVYPCSTYPEPVGNVREHPFADIWWGDSPLLARLRAIRVADLGPTCSSCTKSGYCNRCLALAVIEHGDERAPVLESCRIARAHDIASGAADASLPPGLAEIPPTRRRALPVVG